MVDDDNGRTALLYMFQIGSGYKKRDIQEVEQPVCDRARLLQGLELMIDAGDLVDPEHPAQQLLQSARNRERNDAGENGFKCRGCHHWQDPRKGIAYSWYSVSLPAERERRPRMVTGSATWSRSSGFQLPSRRVTMFPVESRTRNAGGMPPLMQRTAQSRWTLPAPGFITPK